MTNKQVLLAARPTGWVEASNFDIGEAAEPEAGAGEIVLENIYLSVDPYMRGRMNDAKSYIPPFQLGKPIEGLAVARVLESRSEEFTAGDIVSGMAPFANRFSSNGAGFIKIDPALAPISCHLGVLGMPGSTAWVGLKEIGGLKDGENVFISAASGAVGSVAGQIAKNMGCHVAGSAGSDAKCALLTDELGFDAALNYKTADDLFKAVREANPKGIDVLFENVGGPIFEAAIANTNPFARIALCGMISNYNARLGDLPSGPRNLFFLIGRSIKMQGFIVFNYPDRVKEWVGMGAKWLSEGKLKYRESIADGIEATPTAFTGLFKGENTGKQLVRVADE